MIWILVSLSPFLLPCPACPSCQGPVEKGVSAAHKRHRGPVPTLELPAGKTSSPASPSPARAPAHPQATPVPRVLGGDAAAGGEEASGPRPAPPSLIAPFETDRPVLEVDGIPITTGELNAWVAWFRTFRRASVDIDLRDALAALVPIKAAEAANRDSLDAMRARLDEARQRLAAGAPMEKVARMFGDEDPLAPDGGPFRVARRGGRPGLVRAAHSGKVGTIQGPFFTVEGMQLLRIVSYHRMEDPQDDWSEVERVLARFPHASGKGESHRPGIPAGTAIRILDPGMRLAIPPAFRSHIAPLKSNAPR